MTRGRMTEAEAIVVSIEASVADESGPLAPVAAVTPLLAGSENSLRRLPLLLVGAYRGRALLCFALMAAQAFFYNSVFFSLALVLLRYYGVSTERVGLCFIPIAVTNFLGPVLLGPLFDSLGRRKMIAATYCLSGVVLLIASLLFHEDRLTVVTQVAWWAAAFFFASTAASSAYLTVSELFPQEVRATCIALFYALGTLAGGVFGPLVFGHLIGSSSRTPLLIGYTAGAAVMIAAGPRAGCLGAWMRSASRSKPWYCSRRPNGSHGESCLQLTSNLMEPVYSALGFFALRTCKRSKPNPIVYRSRLGWGNCMFTVFDVDGVANPVGAFGKRRGPGWSPGPFTPRSTPPKAYTPGV